MVSAIQFVERGRDYNEARAMAVWLGQQEGCIASRVIGDGHSKPYAAQSLFLAQYGPGAEEWLPDGCSRVVVPRSFPLAVAV